MTERVKLEVPLGAGLEDRLPEARVQRLWHRIEAARTRRSTVPTSFAVAFAAATAILAAVVLLWFHPDHGGTPAALRLSGGRDVPASLLPGRAPTRFEEESEIIVSPGAGLDVLENGGQLFSLALRSGTAEFEVHPGGTRTWRIECGGVTVEVVGTHFTLSRTETSLRVSVTRGAVVVRGANVPDGVVRLGPSESIDVPLSRSVPEASSGRVPAPMVVGDPPAEPRGPETAHEATPRAAPIPSSRLGSTAASAASSASPPEPTPEMEARLGEADAARRSGRLEDAAAILERALAERPGDPRAPIAEFSLGRLYLDSLGNPGRAAPHFSRAVSGGLPAALAEDADARLVEAYARAGDSGAANAAAARYRAKHPAGRRSADVDRWAPAAR
ncbi:MAG TPA: FecR domain-containing protein [Polyangiaceae bacterium]|nr:FecR domain-containing protein [Polyangiaceae bacterium]